MTSTIFKLKSKLLYFTTIEKNLSSFLINRLAESYSSDLSLPQTCHACSHVWASVVGWFCCLEYILSPAVYVTRYLHDIHTAAWKSPAQQVLPNLHTPVRMPSATGNKEDPTRKSQNKALVIHPTQSIVEEEFWHWMFNSIRTLAKTQSFPAFHSAICRSSAILLSGSQGDCNCSSHHRRTQWCPVKKTRISLHAAFISRKTFTRGPTVGSSSIPMARTCFTETSH